MEEEKNSISEKVEKKKKPKIQRVIILLINLIYYIANKLF